MAPTSTAAKKGAKAPKAARSEAAPAPVVKAPKTSGKPAAKAAARKGAAKPASPKAGSPVPKPVRKSATPKATAKPVIAKKAAASKASAAKSASKPAKKAPATKKAPAAKAATNGASPARARVPALAKRSPAEDGRQAPPRRKGPLDKFLLGQLATLEEERATYTRQAASLRAEADQLVAEREPGDVQFDEESGEGDTLAVERERDLVLSAQAAAAVEDIDRAVAKIHDGTYGVCEQCYTSIPKERLRALPYAALCVQCKSAGFSSR